MALATNDIATNTLILQVTLILQKGTLIFVLHINAFANILTLHTSVLQFCVCVCDAMAPVRTEFLCLLELFCSLPWE